MCRSAMVGERSPKAFDVHEVVGGVVDGVAADPPCIEIVLAHFHLVMPGVLRNLTQPSPKRHRLPLEAVECSVEIYRPGLWIEARHWSLTEIDSWLRQGAVQDEAHPEEHLSDVIDILGDRPYGRKRPPHRVVLTKPSRCGPKSLRQLADRVERGTVGPVVAIEAALAAPLDWHLQMLPRLAPG
jgi:hypothetical protein